MQPRIGFLVPPPFWSARVVGVYTKAVSLLHADGALVSLVRGADDMEARAIALEEGWESFALNAGQVLEKAGDNRQVLVDYGLSGISGGNQNPYIALRIGERYGSSGVDNCHKGQESARVELSFSMTLDGALPWDPRNELRRSCDAMHMKSEDLRAAIVSSRALLMRSLARTRSGAGGIDGIEGEGPFGQAFTRLKERQDFPACLVGFGPGTTPAGDDWLAGFLAAADIQGSRLDLSALRTGIQLRLPRTDAAGRALLLGSIAGAPPAYLSRVRQACLRCVGDVGAELSLAITEALAHGASSGRDSLEGFQAGLESIQDFSPRD